MPRSHAVIQFDIWRNPDYRALPQSAQWTYLLLLSQRDVTHAGVLPLMPERWSKGCGSVSSDAIRADLATLEAARFAFVDYETEEVLVRSFMRNDGVYKQPNLMLSAARSVALVESEKLRSVLAFEFRRILPELRQEKSRVAVSEILADLGPATNVTSISTPPAPAAEPEPEPEPEPFPEPFPEPLGDPSGEGEGEGLVVTITESSTKTSVGAQNAQTPAQAPRGSRIAEGYMPRPATISRIREQFPNATDTDLERAHEAFVDYWTGESGARARKADWDATWRNWMRREFGGSGGGARRGGGPRPSGPTPLETKLARAEALKDRPDPRILERGGLVAEARAARGQLSSLTGPSGTPSAPAAVSGPSRAQHDPTLDLLEITA